MAAESVGGPIGVGWQFANDGRNHRPRVAQDAVLLQSEQIPDPVILWCGGIHRPWMS